MNISEKGIEAIKLFEGFKPELYNDVAGFKTIGYGHKVTAFEAKSLLYTAHTILAPAAAEAILKQDLAYIEDAINRFVEPELSLSQFDALCSFTFNEGVAAFESSTMLILINDGAETERIGDEFGRWVLITVDGQKRESEGLHNRRAAERNMFVFGLYPQDGVTNVANHDSSERQPALCAGTQGAGQAGASNQSGRRKG